MALQFRKPATAFSLQPTGKDMAPEKNKAYLEWIRSLRCVVSGMSPVEAAHVSMAAPQYGKTGRGKGQKASDLWALPMTHEEHMLSHDVGEKSYWQSVSIDPCIVALALYAAYPSEKRASMIIDHANERARIARRTALWPAGRNRDGD